MKVLHMLPYLPVPKDFGGALRIYHLLRHFHDHHETTVIAYGHKGNREHFLDEFPALTSHSRILERSAGPGTLRNSQLRSLLSPNTHWYRMTWTPQMQQAIDEVTRHVEFDLIQIEFPMLGQFRYPRTPLRILDAHNVEYENLARMSKVGHSPLRRWYYAREVEKLRTEELDIARRQDAVLVTSTVDRDSFARDLPGTPSVVIPNGVDLQYFSPSKIRSFRPALVFTGMMGYQPNIDAMYFYLQQIHPRIRASRPDATLSIVGKNPPKSLVDMQIDGVTVTGFVEDVRPYVHQAMVYIVPLRMGGGTRLKILEAMALQRPIVTTSIGCEGIDITDGEHALIRDDPREFADAVLELLQNQGLRKRLASAAFELVREQYDWTLITARMEESIQSLRSTAKDPPGHTA